MKMTNLEDVLQEQRGNETNVDVRPVDDDVMTIV